MSGAGTNPVRAYAAVTAAYWAFMLSDGALRMLVLLHFNGLGFSPIQLAWLFLLYELAGIVTNLAAGWLAARSLIGPGSRRSRPRVTFPAATVRCCCRGRPRSMRFAQPPQGARAAQDQGEIYQMSEPARHPGVQPSTADIRLVIAASSVAETSSKASFSTGCSMTKDVSGRKTPRASAAA